MSQLRSDRESGESYVVLRILGALCTGTGALLLVVGGALLAFSLYSFLAGPTMAPPRGGPPLPPPQPVPLASMVPGLNVMHVLWALGLIAAGLQSLAYGSLFCLAIHVAEDTRTSARCLEKLCSRLEPRVEHPGPLFVS